MTMTTSRTAADLHNRVLLGDALSVLAGLPDGCVQCVVTSPPYWGLRDYGTEPTVWRSEAEDEEDDACEHAWGAWQELHDEREGGVAVAGKSRTSERFYGDDPSRRFNGNHQTHTAGQFCTRCGAWRGELGQEPHVDLYIAHLVAVFAQVWRVLREDGTLWLNIGDAYANDAKWGGATGGKHAAGLHGTPVGRQRRHTDLKPKDLILIPARLALALQAWGWTVRQSIIWEKPNAMPESVTDRPTCAYEHLFLLAKNERYYYDAEAIREPGVEWVGRAGSFARSPNGKATHHVLPGQTAAVHREDRTGQVSPGRNRRNVWSISTKAYPEAHFAVMPEKLVEPCVLAGSAPRACETCDAPWERVTERLSFGKAPSATKLDGTMQGGPLSHSRQAYRAMGLEGPPAPKTVGWHPTCTCPHNEGTGRSLILDPFAGSGTVLSVAKQHGRDYLGIELNVAYLPLIERRLSSAQEQLWAEMGGVVL